MDATSATGGPEDPRATVGRPHDPAPAAGGTEDPTRPGAAPPEVTPWARVSFGAAVAALACFAVALVLLAIPVRTPGVQRCGAPGAYLLEGRIDVVPDVEDRIPGPDGEPVTLDAETAEAAREEPCRERVAARAVPAFVLAVTGVVVGLTAFALEVLVVRPRRRRAGRAAVGPPPAPPTA